MCSHCTDYPLLKFKLLNELRCNWSFEKIRKTFARIRSFTVGPGSEIHGLNECSISMQFVSAVARTALLHAVSLKQVTNRETN